MGLVSPHPLEPELTTEQQRPMANGYRNPTEQSIEKQQLQIFLNTETNLVRKIDVFAPDGRIPD